MKVKWYRKLKIKYKEWLMRKLDKLNIHCGDSGV